LPGHTHQPTEQEEVDERVLVERERLRDAVVEDEVAQEQVGQRRLGALETQAFVPPQALGIHPPEQTRKGDQDQHDEQPANQTPGRCLRGPLAQVAPRVHAATDPTGRTGRDAAAR